MKKVAIALALLLAFAPLGMAYFSPDDAESVSNSITTSSSVNAAAMLITPTASASRLASGATAGTLIMINDSKGDVDGGCGTTGSGDIGGSEFIVCVSDGTNWVIV